MDDPQKSRKVDLGRLGRERPSLFFRALRKTAPPLFEDLRDKVLPHYKPRRKPLRMIRDWIVGWNLVYEDGKIPDWIFEQVDSILAEWYRHPSLAEKLLFTYCGGDAIETSQAPLFTLPGNLEIVVSDIPNPQARFAGDEIIVQKVCYAGSSLGDGPPSIDARSNRIAQEALRALIGRAKEALRKLKKLSPNLYPLHAEQKDRQHYEWLVEKQILGREPKTYSTVRVARETALREMFKLYPFRPRPAQKGRPKGKKDTTQRRTRPQK